MAVRMEGQEARAKRANPASQEREAGMEETSRSTQERRKATRLISLMKARLGKGAVVAKEGQEDREDQAGKAAAGPHVAAGAMEAQMDRPEDKVRMASKEPQGKPRAHCN